MLGGQYTTQKRRKGTVMTVIKEHRHFSVLAFGFICFGLGQRLLGVGIVQPLVQDRQYSMILGIVGGLLFIFGGTLLLKVAIWFIKNYNQENRVLKIIAYGLASSILLALIMGLLGQLLYDQRVADYQSLKTVIWSISAIGQTTIKLVTLYALIICYQGKMFSWKEKSLKHLVLLGVIVAIAVIGISLLVPQLAIVVQYIMDTLLLLGTIYYGIFIKKEKE